MSDSQKLMLGKRNREFKLGSRTADVVVRLHEIRLMSIRCEVSNSATNSVAVKAKCWTDKFGTLQVVPAAVLAGVFNLLNLEQSQDHGLAIFWSHDRDKLAKFIDSAR